LISYASLDEMTQLAVPGRTASVADWSADLVGIVVGLYIMRGYAVWKKRSRGSSTIPRHEHVGVLAVVSGGREKRRGIQ